MPARFPIRPSKVTSNLGALVNRLKGSVQPSESLINQLRGLGARPSEIDAWLRPNLPPKLHPVDARQYLKVPPLYAQRGAYRTSGNELTQDQITELAMDMATDTLWERPQFPDRLQYALRQLESEGHDVSALRNIDNDVELGNRFNALTSIVDRASTTDPSPYQFFINDNEELLNSLTDRMYDSALENEIVKPGLHINNWWDFQRQPQGLNRDNYKELVLRTGPSEARRLQLPDREATQSLVDTADYHLSNPGYLGHLRSSIDKYDKNYLIEELQSDLAEVFGKGIDKEFLGLSALPPQMNAIYPRLAALGFEDALQSGAKSFEIPPLEKIRAAGRTQKAAHDVTNRAYGRSLDQGFIMPLLRRAGQSPETPPRRFDITDEMRRLYEEDPDFLGFRTGGLVRRAKG